MIRIRVLLVGLILALSHHSLGDIFVAGELSPMLVRDGTQAHATCPAMDPTGRFVAFVSRQPLVAEHRVVGTGAQRRFVDQVYLYDLKDRSYELISVGLDGFAPGDEGSGYPAVSADARYVAFLSASRYLVENDTTGGILLKDCFVRDRLLQQTTRVSVSSAGEEANDACFWYTSPAISHNGRYIVFCSRASNLVENDENDSFDVFVHDLETRTTEIVSLWPDGSQMKLSTLSATISSDGRYVAFASRLESDVFVRDMKAGTTDMIVSGCNGAWGPVWHSSLQISDDGRFVVFACLSNNPMPDLPPAWGYIYLFDRETREMAMVAALDKPLDSGDWLQPVQVGGYTVVMSRDGRYVFYTEWEGNRKKLELYRYDRVTTRTERVVYASPVPRPYLFERYPVAAVNGDGSLLVFATQSREFYAYFEAPYSVFPPWDTVQFRLFRVELWDTPSGVSRWAYHR